MCVDVVTNLFIMHIRSSHDHLAGCDPIAISDLPLLLDYFSMAADLDTPLFDYFLYSRG
jgi:hypothetical protein